jgi:hydrogenase maturation protease
VVDVLNRRGLPPGVAAIDAGTGGLYLLQLLEGGGRVIVVDSADMGREPGEFVRFTPDEARLAIAEESFSFHHAGLGEVLALARAVEQSLPAIVIFGVQPEQVGWGSGLSPAVEAAIPALVKSILQEVGGDDA